MTGKAAKAEAWRRAYERQPARRAERQAITTRPKADAARDAPTGRVDDDPPARRLVSQAVALVRRYVDLQLLDRPNLLSMAGTSLLVDTLLVLVFGNVHVGDRAGLYATGPANGLMLLFLVLFSSMWFGCPNAAKEVVKEADIYRMERNHSLDLTAYYLSKLSVLTVLSLAQAALLYVPVKVLCRPDGDFVWQGVTVAITTFVGVALGLVISSGVRTVDVAATLVPVVIIPQFVLAGAVMKVTWLAKLLATGAALYWANKGILSSEPPFLREAIDAPDWFPSHAMLLIHAAVYVAAGWALLRMKDKGQTTGGLIRLTRRAMRDPSGPAARYLAGAKASLVSVSAMRFVADRDVAHIPLPTLPANRPMDAAPPLDLLAAEVSRLGIARAAVAAPPVRSKVVTVTAVRPARQAVTPAPLSPPPGQDSTS